ncbi:hypothetical protein J8J27_21975, partial [Mycobacterium tuberculosis]|nr:hypothetical protein [Mycobacterium tuberculosis]
VLAELVAHAIAGHHAGLPDRGGDPSALNERLDRATLARLDGHWIEDLRPDVSRLMPSVPFKGAKDHVAFRLAFLGRMIFSCLVDADYKDTEAFYGRTEGKVADRAWPALAERLPELINRLDRALAAKAAAAPDAPVNQLRQRVLGHVRAQAALALI